MSEHLMKVMGGEGDVKVIWDESKSDEVEAARATFDKLIEKGYKAFSVKKNGEKSEMITVFDPDLEKIILAAQISGG
jgi:hypothetical protein